MPGVLLGHTDFGAGKKFLLLQGNVSLTNAGADNRNAYMLAKASFKGPAVSDKTRYLVVESGYVTTWTSPPVS